MGTGGLGHPDRFIARQQWGIEEELSEKDLDHGLYLRTGKTRSALTPGPPAQPTTALSQGLLLGLVKARLQRYSRAATGEPGNAQ